MSDHPYVPDDNNAFLDASRAIGTVVVPFFVIFAIGLYYVGGIGQPVVEHGEDHAEDAADGEH